MQEVLESLENVLGVTNERAEEPSCPARSQKKRAVCQKKVQPCIKNKKKINPNFIGVLSIIFLIKIFCVIVPLKKPAEYYILHSHF